jgi:nitrate reductase gamma subunit
MYNAFLFSVWPYLTIALFVVGLVIRYFAARQRTAAVSSQACEVWALFGLGRALGFSLVSLFLLHLAGLLYPQEVLRWNSSMVRLYLLEGVAFLVGLVAVANFTYVIWRHLGHSRRSTITELCDAVFLSLTFTAVLSGSLMAILYRWGSSWGVMTLRPYVISIFGGQPATEFVIQMPFFVRLHIFSAFAALALIPATRVAALFVAAIDFVSGWIAKPILVGVEAAENWLGRRNLAVRIWPEED